MSSEDKAPCSKPYVVVSSLSMSSLDGDDDDTDTDDEIGPPPPRLIAPESTLHAENSTEFGQW